MTRSTRRRDRQSLVVVGIVTLIACGCAVTPVRNRDDVARDLRSRLGHEIAPSGRSTQATIPDGIALDDGLSADEAVAIALWNNPAFRGELARLGIARAELQRAGLLRNPILSMLFPVGPKQFEANLAWQLESIWQRPRRVSLAQLDLARVAEGLVRNGLDLALRVKLAHAELGSTRTRASLARERADALGEMEALAAARLRAGDLDAASVDDARAAALEAALDADRLAARVIAAVARLGGLLGCAGDLKLEFGDPGPSLPAQRSPSVPALPALLELAWAARPDLRAAELTIEHVGARAGLSRTEYVTITAIIDANAIGESGSESGPGLSLPLPLFDRGQADRARAAAELERALHGYAGLRNRIAAQVRESHADLLDARHALERYRDGIVRLRAQSARVAERSYAAGEIPYQDVLAPRIVHLEALARQAEVSAELLRARARLEYAIGSDLDRQPGLIARTP